MLHVTIGAVVQQVQLQVRLLITVHWYLTLQTASHLSNTISGSGSLTQSGSVRSRFRAPILIRVPQRSIAACCLLIPSEFRTNTAIGNSSRRY